MFRKYYDIDLVFGKPEVSMEKLITSITEPYRANILGDRGKAFHAILEGQGILCQDRTTGKQYYSYYSETFKQEHQFDRQMFLEVYYRNKDFFTPSATAEVKTTIHYPHRLYNITIVAKADKLLGKAIAEWKTQWGKNDDDFKDDHPDWYRNIASEYESSLQWRIYLKAFGAGMMRYTVCQVCPEPPFHNYFKLHDIDTLEVYPYYGMDTDIELYVDSFIDFIEDNNLGEYFEKKGTEWYE